MCWRHLVFLNQNVDTFMFSAEEKTITTVTATGDESMTT